MSAKENKNRYSVFDMFELLLVVSWCKLLLRQANDQFTEKGRRAQPAHSPNPEYDVGVYYFKCELAYREEILLHTLIS